MPEKMKYASSGAINKVLSIVKKDVLDKSFQPQGKIQWEDLKSRKSLKLKHGTYIVEGENDFTDNANPTAILNVFVSEVQYGGKKVNMIYEIFSPDVELDMFLNRFRIEGEDMPKFVETLNKSDLYTDGARPYNPQKSFVENLTKVLGEDKIFIDSPLYVSAPIEIDLKGFGDLGDDAIVTIYKFFDKDSDTALPVTFKDSSNTLNLVFPNGSVLKGNQGSTVTIFNKKSLVGDSGTYVCVNNIGDDTEFLTRPTGIVLTDMVDKETRAFRKTFDAGEVSFRLRPTDTGKTIVYTNKAVDDTADKLSGKNGSAAVATRFGNTIYVDIRNVK